MRTRIVAMMALAAVAAAATIQLSAQARPTAAPAAKGAIPRTADGHPDLTGVYDLATLTPVERPNGMSATLTDEEAVKLERQAAARKIPFTMLGGAYRFTADHLAAIVAAYPRGKTPFGAHG
jgi:hypothetical protein